MSEVSFVCDDCGCETTVDADAIDDRKDGDDLYCSDCTQPDVVDFRDIDDDKFPIWRKHYARIDNWQFAREFCWEALDDSEIDIESLPCRDMKTITYQVWFKVDSQGRVHGPYEQRGDDEPLQPN